MMLLLYLVLNQLITKLDRRLRKASNACNGFQAVVRVDGPPLQDCLPKVFVRWAIREDIPEPQPMLRESSSPAAQEANDAEPDSDSDLEEALQEVM